MSLAFPARKCSACGMLFGGAAQAVRVLALTAIGLLVVAGLIIGGTIVAAYAAQKDTVAPPAVVDTMTPSVPFEEPVADTTPEPVSVALRAGNMYGEVRRSLLAAGWSAYSVEVDELGDVSCATESARCAFPEIERCDTDGGGACTVYFRNESDGSALRIRTVGGETGSVDGARIDRWEYRDAPPPRAVVQDTAAGEDGRAAPAPGSRDEAARPPLSTGLPTDRSESVGDRFYRDVQVEKPVAMAPGVQGPSYPDVLRTSGIEGIVLAQFVVDTTGRAEMNTFSVIKSENELFSNAVKDALERMRFVPAELRGRKVRQLVQQPFQFSLNR